MYLLNFGVKGFIPCGCRFYPSTQISCVHCGKNLLRAQRWWRSVVESNNNSKIPCPFQTVQNELPCTIPLNRGHLEDIHFAHLRFLLYSSDAKCHVRTISGNADNRCCVFPFKYNNVTYHTCTYVDHKKPWCAVTQDYDRDGVWGECPGWFIFLFIC